MPQQRPKEIAKRQKKKKFGGRSGFRYSLIFLSSSVPAPGQMARGQLLPCPIMFLPLSCLSPQFLCLKNIRTFLSTCYEKFGLKRSELFEAFDLFDVQDFGKVSWV